MEREESQISVTEGIKWRIHKIKYGNDCFSGKKYVKVKCVIQHNSSRKSIVGRFY